MTVAPRSTRMHAHHWLGFCLAWLALMPASVPANDPAAANSDGSTGAGAAATPVERLLQRLPAGAVAVVTAENAAAAVDHALTTDAYRWLMEVPAVQRWRTGKEFQRLMVGLRLAGVYLGVDAETALRELFGSAVVVAAYPIDPLQQRYASVLLLHSQNEMTLQRIMTVIGTSDGKRKATARSHLGQSYFVRQEDGTTDYWAQVGPVGIVSNDERLLHQVLGGGDGWATQPAVRKFWQALPVGAWLRAVLLPRPLDALWDKAPRPTEPGEARLRDGVEAAWRATDAVAVTLATGTQVELGLHLAGRVGDLPDDLRPGPSWSRSPQQLAAFWAAVPRDALLAAAGPVDLAWLYRSIAEVANAKGDRGFADLDYLLAQIFPGFDFVDDVLPALGPGLGGWIAAAPVGPLPEVVLVVPIQPVAAAQDPDWSIARGLEDNLRLLFALVAVDRHSKANLPTRLEIMQHQPARLYALQGLRADWPTVQPAFAVAGDRLVLGTHPDAIASALTRFADSAPPAAAPAADRQLFARLRSAPTLAWLRQPATAASLRTSLPPLADAVPKLIDRVELTGTARSGHAALYLTMAPPAPTGTEESKP